MAQTTPLTRHLQVQFQIGTSTNGRPKLKNQNYAYLSPSAVDDDILAVGQALAALSADTLYQIARVDQTGIAATPATSTSSGSTSTSTTTG